MLRELAPWVCLLAIGCSGAGGGSGGDEPHGGSGSSAGGNSSAGTTGTAGTAPQGGSAGSSSAGSGGSTSAGGSGGEVGTAGTAGTSAGGTGGSGGGSGGSGGAVNPSCTPSSGTESIPGGALLDKATCLMWEETPGFISGGNWEPARDYCAGLTLAGFDDWRMPTNVELNSSPVAFIGRLGTTPRYTPDGATDLGDFHYCGITHWDAPQPNGCGWVGPGNMDGTICVRGEAASALPAPEGCTCDAGMAGFSPVVE